MHCGVKELDINVYLKLNGYSSRIRYYRLEEVGKMDYTKIYNEELIALVKEKIKSGGEIKAVKFVREQTDMSLIQAKKFVDFCKE